MHGALLLSSKVSKEIDPTNPNFLWGSTLGEKEEEKETPFCKIQKSPKIHTFTIITHVNRLLENFSQIIIVILICKLVMESIHTMTNVQLSSKFVAKCGSKSLHTTVE